MLLVCGLRDVSVGTDTLNYILTFSTGFYDDSPTEYFFVLFSYGVFSLTKSANLYLLCIAILTYIPLYIIIRKESVNPSFSLLLFLVSTSLYFFETFNILRQSIAIVFILYVYYYYNKEKYVQAATFFLVAVLFHTSSLLILPLLLLKYIKISYPFILITLFVSIIIGLSGMFSFVLGNEQIFEFLSKNEVSSPLSKYIIYADSDRIASTSNIVGKLSHMIPLTVTCLLTYQRRKDRLYDKIFFAGVVLLNCFIFFKYAERMFSGLTLLQIFLLPQAYYEAKQLKKMLMVAYISLLCLFFIYTIMRLDSTGLENSNITQYKFFF